MAKKLNIFNRFNKNNKMNNEEVENNIDNQEEINTEAQVNQEETIEETLDPIAEKDAKIAELNDKFLRLYSEFDNFRKRTAKEKIEIIKSAGENVIKDMLPIVDDFKRAAEANKDVNDADALKEGFELISNKFYKTLEAKGLVAIEAKGEVFNADIHQALTNIPAPSEDLKGKVIDVVEKGYYLGDKIIRFPKVVVGQ
jgi:molecular chaperone GrpE